MIERKHQYFLWCDAMELEIGGFVRIKTWSICDLLHGKEVIGCKWVFTVKHHTYGSINR